MKVRTIAPPIWKRTEDFAFADNQRRLVTAVAYAHMEDQTVDVIIVRSEGAEKTFAERDRAIDWVNRTLTEFGFDQEATDYRAGSKQSLEAWLRAQATDEIQYEGEPLPSRGVAYRFERQ
tara:strand:- start:2820 stop:3179 length:360 start_codon:yes stop_codon:yes gene_type:complete